MDGYALLYGADAADMWRTMLCEDPKLDPAQQSFATSSSGKRENSWGLAQINLDSHPEVTKQEATDPRFSIEFMAKEFASGEQSDWSCWRIIHGKP